jgi:hypothetical protein
MVAKNAKIRLPRKKNGYTVYKVNENAFIITKDKSYIMAVVAIYRVNNKNVVTNFVCIEKTMYSLYRRKSLGSVRHLTPKTTKSRLVNTLSDKDFVKHQSAFVRIF